MKISKMRKGFKKWSDEKATFLRKEMGLGEYDRLCPYKIADHLNLKIYAIDEVPNMLQSITQIMTTLGHGQFHALAMIAKSGQKVIIYNPSNTEKRRHSDLMHEISHMLCEHKFESSFETNLPVLMREYNEAYEQEANWLGGCLLFPKCAVFATVKHKRDEEATCDRYGISSEMFRYRVNVTGAKRIFARKRMQNS